MSKEIQLPTWKKQRIESPPYPSYHHTSGSTINILFAVELLRPYGEYFEGFKLQSPTPLEIRLLPPPPDFGISDLWEIIESKEEEKEETENQEFTYQNLITENPEFENPNLQNQQNLNSLLQLPPQQNQQSFQQPPQPPNLDPMVYTPIAKLDNFTSEEDDAQV
ncbi:hypothetical protein G9A89_016731 [Geosiphon pyriformis]|nr:hypothetical protein G9A89_016731 [Geosiphon pyriformis]